METIFEQPTPVMLPMLALRGLVLFEGMILHFDVGRDKSKAALDVAMEGDQRIYLAAQKDLTIEDPDPEAIYAVGVVAKIRQILKLPGSDTVRVVVEGLYRASTVYMAHTTPYLQASVLSYPLIQADSADAVLQEAMRRTLKDYFEDYAGLNPRMPKELLGEIFACEDLARLSQLIAGNIMLSHVQKQAVLEESKVLGRVKLLTQMLANEVDVLEVEQHINEAVKESIDKNQREYYLREQLKAISNELGEGDAFDELEAYRDKILSLKLAKEVEQKLTGEVDRLLKMPPNSHEGAVIRSYLDICLELPWNMSTKDKIDIAKAQKILDKEHYGLEKVKERILEILAVRRLAPDIKGQILCLAGPPGVGKTSVAKSVAKAMGRKYVRLSLGGVRDESDIRGHRRTYIGAMPGRIMNAMKLAGSKNPVVLLDEIDKMGNDFRGDPSSAMLEVLDSEQNTAFRDHYIEVPFDLSDVLFITTANDLGMVPAPLLDRMEVITLSSYTREEKFQIAKKHLAPKQLKRHGLTGRTLRIADEALYALCDFYTREAGVRTLERTIGTLCRKAAKKLVAGECTRVSITARNLEDFLGAKKYKTDTLRKADEVGVATGLAWTSVGGETMPVEVSVLKGAGKVQLTGSLGDVMKESATAAITYIRSIAERYGIPEDFYSTRDIHIHVPEGAVPKDGPSAGITMATALVSALSGTAVRRDLAMTGEITLRGRVLPIGGLREKTMAAYRLGVKTVVIPAENEPDLTEVEPIVKEHLQFILADRMETVLDAALVRPAESKTLSMELGELPAAKLPVGRRESAGDYLPTQA